MIRRIDLTLAALVVGVCAAWVCPSQAMAGPPRAASADPGPPLFAERPGITEFSGRLIVRPLQPAAWQRAGLDAGQAQARITAARVRLEPLKLHYYPEVDEYIVRVPQAAGDQAATRGHGENKLARELMATGDYQYAEPDWTCYPVAVPNDPGYPNQWHLLRIQAPQAWDTTTGLSSIIVGIVDTGVDLTHPDLAAIRVPGFNSATQTAESDGGEVSDINGHGTHTSGTAAAIGNNALGVTGVGWNLKFMMVRCTNNPDGSAGIGAILSGARWAVDHGCKIASCSYSGVGNGTVQTSGEYIKSQGGLLCYAAGNDSADLAGFDFPDVIVVGASNDTDDRAWFSAYGRGTDLFAPGVDIYATSIGGGYGWASGTSFSTPMTAGALGVVWSVNPSFTAWQVETLLLNGCDDIGTPGEDDFYGHGRLNVFRGVQDAVAAMSPVPPVASDDAVPLAFADAPITIDVLANDYDINLDPIAIQSIAPNSERGATLTVSIGTGPGGRDQILYLAPSGTAGLDSFSYTCIAGGLTDTATVSVSVLDPQTFRDPENPVFTAEGLVTDYYDTGLQARLPDFSLLTPFASDIQPDIHFATYEQVLGSGREDQVSVVFTGHVTVPADDVYTFYVRSNDGSRLYIGATLVVDNDGAHYSIEKDGTINLKAGTHAFRAEYFDNSEGASCAVRFESSSLEKQLIPPAAFTHAVTCPADLNGDGLVDFADYLVFLNLYDAADLAVDFTGDGLVDFGDYLEFLNLYEAGC